VKCKPTGAGIINDKNNVDWVGTESGMPSYPVWSTGCDAPGAGSQGVSPESSPTQFCPKGSDATLQSPDVWFWQKGTPIKSLATLIEMYHSTVGNNAVLELDFAIDRTGNIDPVHAVRYREFGAWIRDCYSAPAAHSGWQLTNTIELAVPASQASGAAAAAETQPNAAATARRGSFVDRLAIQEDLSRGQRITGWTVEALVAGVWKPFTAVRGSAVGHKRIVLAAGSGLGSGAPITKFRLNVTGGVGLPANISLAAFYSCPSA